MKEIVTKTLLILTQFSATSVRGSHKLNHILSEITTITSYQEICLFYEVEYLFVYNSNSLPSQLATNHQFVPASPHSRIPRSLLNTVSI